VLHVDYCPCHLASLKTSSGQVAFSSKLSTTSSKAMPVAAMLCISTITQYQAYNREYPLLLLLFLCNAVFCSSTMLQYQAYWG